MIRFLYFFITTFFLTGLGSFFRANDPSNEQRNPRCAPHPSISFNVTAEALNVNFSTQGSPPSRYSATVGEVMIASPFNSPVQAPLFFSK
ncbi:MAG: hypothetical protein WDO16_09905 [Bacteroidota bacterium]